MTKLYLVIQRYNDMIFKEKAKKAKLEMKLKLISELIKNMEEEKEIIRSLK